VAGIIAGSAAASGGDPGFSGMAPGAHLINLRVLGADGSGSTSDVMAAIDWAIEARHRYNIRVLNLSLGHPVLEPYADDPLGDAVARATAAGILVVCAAGNDGRNEAGQTVSGGIVSPCNHPAALTVGALDTYDTADRAPTAQCLSTAFRNCGDVFLSRGRPDRRQFGEEPMQVDPGKRPAERLCHRSIPVLKGEQIVFHGCERREIVRRQDLALHDREVDFDLIYQLRAVACPPAAAPASGLGGGRRPWRPGAPSHCP
jgi:subtilisin family serine protease